MVEEAREKMYKSFSMPRPIPRGEWDAEFNVFRPEKTKGMDYDLVHRGLKNGVVTRGGAEVKPPRDKSGGLSTDPSMLMRWNQFVLEEYSRGNIVKVIGD